MYDSFIFETDQTKEKVSNVYFAVRKSVDLGRIWVPDLFSLFYDAYTGTL